MIVTENVEIIIENHYSSQITYLKENDSEHPMLKKIEKFKSDEVEHKNLATTFRKKTDCKLNSFIGGFVQIICKTAIFLSTKI